MGLLKQWRDVAYSQQADKAKLQKFWAEYFVIEKGIYEQLLSNPDEVVRGTVKELADKYKDYDTGRYAYWTGIPAKTGVKKYLKIPVTKK